MALDNAIVKTLLWEAHKEGKRLEASYTGILGMVIAALRHALDLSQSDLARESGLSQATISRIEAGEADITAPQMDSLASALGKSSGFIFDAADEIRATLREHQIHVSQKAERNGYDALPAAALMAVAGALLGANPIGLLLGSVAGAVVANRKGRSK